MDNNKPGDDVAPEKRLFTKDNNDVSMPESSSKASELDKITIPKSNVKNKPILFNLYYYISGTLFYYSFFF